MALNCRRSPRAVLSDARILQRKIDFMSIARQVCPGFKVFPETRTAINAIFRWCLCLDGNLDPDRGLWLWGNIGTGKSTMLAIVNRFCYAFRPPSAAMSLYTRDYRPEVSRYRISIYRTKDICDDFAVNGFPALKRYIYSGRLGLDDLGSETRLTGYFGSVVNVIEEVLHRRYDFRDRSHTHVTTNLSPEQIAEVYGDRVADRCNELFNFVHFGEYTNRPCPDENS